MNCWKIYISLIVSTSLTSTEVSPIKENKSEKVKIGLKLFDDTLDFASAYYVLEPMPMKHFWTPSLGV